MAKKLPYEVTDIDALEKAYPELVSVTETTCKTTVKGEIVSDKTTSIKMIHDKEKLYRLVKLNHEIGRETAGVTVKDTITGVAE